MQNMATRLSRNPEDFIKQMNTALTDENTKQFHDYILKSKDAQFEDLRKRINEKQKLGVTQKKTGPQEKPQVGTLEMCPSK